MLSNDLTHMCQWLRKRHEAGKGLTADELDVLFANATEILTRASILESGTVPRSMREELDLRPYQNVTRLPERQPGKGADQCKTTH